MYTDDWNKKFLKKFFDTHYVWRTDSLPWKLFNKENGKSSPLTNKHVRVEYMFAECGFFNEMIKELDPNYLNSKKRNNRKKNTEGLITVETCKRCFATYKPQPKCPVCSYESQMRQRYIKHEEGQLQELKRVEIETDQKKKLISAARTYEELLQVEKILGYKSGWAYNIHKVRNNGKFAKKTPLFHKGQKLKQTTEGGEVKVSNQNRSFASMKQKGLVAEYIASSPIREYFISCNFNPLVFAILLERIVKSLDF